MTREPPPVPLREFLESLRADGFVIGVDDYLRVGRVICLDSDWSLDRLRIALRAVLTVDVRQRQAFDGAFDRFFGGTTGRDIEVPVPGDPEPVRARRGRARWLLAGLAVVALAGALLLWRLRAGGEGEDVAVAPAQPLPGLQVPAEPGASPGPPPEQPGDQPAPAEPDIQVEPVTPEPAAEAAEPIVEPPPPPPLRWAETAPDDWTLPVALAGGGAAALAVTLAFVLLARRRRRRFAAGPWAFRRQVPTDEIGLVYGGTQIEDGAAHLTWQSELAGAHEIDVERTVTATVAAGGYPRIAFAPPPPAPEYVVLTDTSPGARAWRPMYEELFDRLETEGVRIRRYDFEAEPNVCVSRDGMQTVSLNYLAEHSDALIVVGDGRQGWDPLEARAPDWVETLRGIPHRLWLNPLPPARWPAGARHVAESTPMEHATVDALAALHPGADRLEMSDRPYPAIIELQPGSATALAALRDHLGAAGLRCLQLSAVAGEPDADMARWLAHRFELDLHDGDRLRLLSLPWFTTGAWPAGMRDRLVESLRAEDAELEQQVRRTLIDLLNADEPPVASAAHLRWRLDLARHRARLGDPTGVAELRALTRSPVHGEAAAGLVELGAADLQRRSLRLLSAAGALALIGGAALAAPRLLAGRPQDHAAGVATICRSSDEVAWQNRPAAEHDALIDAWVADRVTDPQARALYEELRPLPPARRAQRLEAAAHAAGADGCPRRDFEADWLARRHLADLPAVASATFDRVPADATIVVVEPGGILVDDRRLAALTGWAARPPAGDVPNLRAVLDARRMVVLAVHADTPWSLLRRVGQTSEHAGIDQLRWAVRVGEQVQVIPTFSTTTEEPGIRIQVDPGAVSIDDLTEGGAPETDTFPARSEPDRISALAKLDGALQMAAEWAASTTGQVGAVRVAVAEDTPASWLVAVLAVLSRRAGPTLPPPSLSFVASSDVVATADPPVPPAEAPPPSPPPEAVSAPAGTAKVDSSRVAKVPSIKIGQPVATGDLDKNIIRRYLKRQNPRLQYCYEKELLLDRTLSGTVSATFTIGPDGKVLQASAAGVSDKVAGCVAEVIRTVEFPAAKGGGIVKVTYPFDFRPSGDAPPPPTTGTKQDRFGLDGPRDNPDPHVPAGSTDPELEKLRRVMDGEGGGGDPDKDKDRILDKADKCPDEAETYNGVDDDDGCPDKGRVVVTETHLEILEKIYFEYGKAVITPASYPILDAAAATMKGNPDIRLVEVQGHSDDRSAGGENLALSRGRASAVRGYLVKQGVEAARLRAAGYGETRPIDRGNNERAWAKNRRVEFVILERDGGGAGE